MQSIAGAQLFFCPSGSYPRQPQIANPPCAGASADRSGKANRAALVDAKKGETFLHPLVRFGFTEEEQRKAEQARAREAEHAALRRGGQAVAEDEEDAGGDEDMVESPGHLMDGDEDAVEAPMPPPSEAGTPEAHAA